MYQLWAKSRLQFQKDQKSSLRWWVVVSVGRKGEMSSTASIGLWIQYGPKTWGCSGLQWSQMFPHCLYAVWCVEPTLARLSANRTIHHLQFCNSAHYFPLGASFVSPEKLGWSCLPYDGRSVRIKWDKEYESLLWTISVLQMLCTGSFHSRKSLIPKSIEIWWMKFWKHFFGPWIGSSRSGFLSSSSIWAMRHFQFWEFRVSIHKKRLFTGSLSSMMIRNSYIGVYFAHILYHVSIDIFPWSSCTVARDFVGFSICTILGGEDGLTV